MMLCTHSILLTGLLALQASAAPALLPSLTTNLQDLLSSINGSDFSQIQSVLQNIQPSPTPTSAEEAASRLQTAYAAARPTGFFQSAALIIKQGLASNDLASIAAGFDKQGENSANNNNPRNPSKSIYPKKDKLDGTFKQTEQQIRQQIYIPSTFTYGAKPPVILVPGTGVRGSQNFIGNLIPLLQGKSYADIVWINPPRFQLADAQTNAETVAYAINYISGISRNRKVSVVGWSQGSESMQWALKYWPSARAVTTNQIAVSADYAGTTVANLIDPAGAVPYPPSIKQQEYDSNFIKALRSNGGDSAYVPTTTIYSGFFDEIVEPQQGFSASAYLNDVRKVGVTNNQVQLVCPAGSPGAGFFTHESVLSHPLTFALIEDALKHNDVGRPNRLNLAQVCSRSLTPGLSLADFLATEATIPLAAFQLLLFSPKTQTEPPIRGYAQ